MDNPRRLVMAAVGTASAATGFGIRSGSFVLDTEAVAGEPVRLKFSAAQVELLREILSGASPAIIETGEQMARGEVVQRPDAEAVVRSSRMRLFRPGTGAHRPGPG